MDLAIFKYIIYVIVYIIFIFVENNSVCGMK